MWRERNNCPLSLSGGYRRALWRFSLKLALSLFAAAALTVSTGCAHPPGKTAATSDAKTMDNPLLQTWAGPYGGTPPFDQVRVEQFKPALAASMDLYRRDVEAVLNNSEPPTFAN